MLNILERVDDSNILISQLMTFDKDNPEKYIEEFNKLKDIGIIVKTCEFYDNFWYLTDGLETKKIILVFDEISFSGQKKKRNLEFNYSDLILAFRCYFIMKIRTLDYKTVYSINAYFRRIMRLTLYFDEGEVREFKKNLKKYGSKKDKFDKHHGFYMSCIMEFLEFFELLAIEEEYYIIYEDMLAHSYSYDKRLLPSFDSVFKFDDIIDTFIVEATQIELEFFFPIVLWWKITVNIPMRSREFTVTPYKCNNPDQNNYSLTIRRSTQKGHNSGKIEIDPSIEKAYKCEEIAITKEINDLIEQYKALVDDYDFKKDFYGEGKGDAKQRKFLLSNRALKKNSRKLNNLICTRESGDIDYLAPRQMQLLLKYFYIEIVEKKYKRQIVQKCANNNQLKEYQIEKMQLMDTRHLAIMNMILQDISLIAVQKLSGHSKIESTYHYYSHLDNYIQNYTYHLAKKYHKQKTDLDILNMEINALPNEKWAYFHMKIKNSEVEAVQKDDGWCLYNKSDTIECQKYEFECENGCVYYVPDNENIKKIQQRLIENKNIKDSAILTIQELLKNRKKIKEFEKLYKTEINVLQSCIKQDAEILSEHSIKRI